MTDEAERADAYLGPDRRDREGRAAARRERGATLRRATVVASLRRSLALAALVLAAACGGNKRIDTHARATNVQAQCCHHLQAGDRDRCLAEVPKIEDPQVAHHSTSQRTFACVAEHFICDPATGRPTPPSAQAQLECVQDLE